MPRPPTPLEPVPAAALSHVDAGAAALPTGHRLDQRSSAPSSNPALVGEWDPEDRETILKSASRPRFVESTGMRIRAFLDDAELFLTLCGRPRSRWGHFVLSWLGHDESEKVRRSHIVESVARYDDFRAGLVTLFGRFEFKGQYREALRSLKQSPGETVAAYAARASDLCSRAYPDFSTETQLDLATEHFISGIVDASSREFLRREFARRQLTWQEAVQLAQASEVNATSSSSSSAAIAGGPHVATADSLARDTCSRAPLYGGGAQSSFQRRGACDAPSTPQVRNAGGAVDTSRRFDNWRENNGSRRHDNPIQPLRSPRFVWDRRARDESDRRPRETAPYQHSRERESRASADCDWRGHDSPSCGYRSERPYADRYRSSSRYTAGGTRRDTSPGQYASDTNPRFPRRRSSSGKRQSRDDSAPSHGADNAVWAVSSAGNGAPQLFCDCLLDGRPISRALFDTGATYSMMPVSTYQVLRRETPLERFSSSSPEIVGVGGARVFPKGYADVLLTVGRISVRHPIIVVDELPFPLIVGMDVLRPHKARLFVDELDSVCLTAETCVVCLERRAPPMTQAAVSSYEVARTLKPTVLEANAASWVRVAVPEMFLSGSLCAVAPFECSTGHFTFDALPAVCGVSNSTIGLVLVNPSAEPVHLLEGTPVATVCTLGNEPPKSATLASVTRLPREEKLSKVLRELNFDGIALEDAQREALRSLVEEYLDAFSECESDVGTTAITFHEIDTADARPLRQPVRRLPYGDQRKAVEHEIDKLVEAGLLARQCPHGHRL